MFEWIRKVINYLSCKEKDVPIITAIYPSAGGNHELVMASEPLIKCDGQPCMVTDFNPVTENIIEKENEMPLVKGKKARSKKGFSENVKREMQAGKPQAQSVAIAYSEARRGKKGKKK